MADIQLLDNELYNGIIGSDLGIWGDKEHKRDGRTEDKINELVIATNTINGSWTGLASKLDKDGYTGTAQNLKDEIDLKADLVNGKVPLSQMDDSLVGAVEYKEAWDANTNTPTLPSTPTEKGIYYVVSVAGTKFGLKFGIGDWIISNGSIWQKLDATLNAEDITQILADAVLTGNPTAPTPNLSDSDTSIATTAFVKGIAGNKYTFDTMAELQLATGLLAGDVVEVLWYYSKGDGGGHKRKKNILGSTYEWDILNENGIYNVKHYGAKSDWDYVTETGTDCYSVIMEIINRIPKTANNFESGAIILFDGQFYSNGNINIEKTGIKLKGVTNRFSKLVSGFDGVTINFKPLINDLGIGRLFIEDLQIEAFGQAQVSGTGIVCENMHESLWVNHHFSFFKTNMYFKSCYLNNFINTYCINLLDQTHIGIKMELSNNNNFLNGIMRQSCFKILDGAGQYISNFDIEPGNTTSEFVSCHIANTRFERISLGSTWFTWLKFITGNKVENCSLHMDGSVWATDDKYYIEVYNDNEIEINPAYPHNIFYFIGDNNKIKLNTKYRTVSTGINYNTLIPYVDFGLNNIKELYTDSNIITKDYGTRKDGLVSGINEINTTKIKTYGKITNLFNSASISSGGGTLSENTLDFKDPVGLNKAFKMTYSGDECYVDTGSLNIADGDSAYVLTMWVYNPQDYIGNFKVSVNRNVFKNYPASQNPIGRWHKIIQMVKPSAGSHISLQLIIDGAVAGQSLYFAYPTITKGSDIPSSMLENITDESPNFELNPTLNLGNINPVTSTLDKTCDREVEVKINGVKYYLLARSII